MTAGEAAAEPASGQAAWQRPIVAFLTLLYALLLLPMWQPRFLNPDSLSSGLDSGWAFALHAIHAAGLQFGRDLVFTYGPLGFLEPRYYHPATFVVVFLRSVAFALIFWFALWSLADRAGWHIRSVLVWMVTLTTVTGTLIATTDHPPEYFLCALLVVTQVCDRGGRRPLSWWLLVAALACASLIKFSYFIAAAFAILASTIDDAAIRRKVPKALPLFLVSLIAFDAAAGQHLSFFLPYLSYSIDLAGAYSQAMATIGPAHQVALFVLAVVALVVGVWRGSADGRLQTLVLAAALAAVLWVLFKQGYVRHWHIIGVALELALVVTLCIPFMWRTRDGRLFAIVALGSVVLLTLIGWRQLEGGQLVLTPRVLRDNVHAASQMIRHGRLEFERDYQHSIRQLVAGSGISKVTGTVDVYPWDVWIPVVHGFTYRPRPVLQSYAAYTAKLADINARHLTGPQAPDTVFFEVKPIDGRLATLEDAPSWPVILTQYRLETIDGPRVRLSRSVPPVVPVTRQLRRSSERLGSAFALPAHHGPLLLAVDLKPSIPGRLWSTLYKGPPVVIDVWTHRGEPRRFVYVSTLANVPFLISPLITDTASFAALASGELVADAAVERVAFDVKRRDRWKVDSTFTVTVSTFEIPPAVQPSAP